MSRALEILQTLTGTHTRKLGLKLVILQCLKYNLQVLNILLTAPGVYKDVINEDYNKRIQVRIEYTSHHIHKGSDRISQPKKHNQELIMSPEGSLRNVCCPNA